MNGASTLRNLARALGGDVVGRHVLAPGPGHSPHDRSLWIRISPGAPDGFLCGSFAGDNWKTCKDYVRERLGLTRDARQAPPSTPKPKAPQDEAAAKKRRAAALFDEAIDPVGTIVERYLASRRLNLADDLPADIRFHPRCPWKDEQTGEVLRVPAMLAAMRNVITDEITAVHRTALSPDGKKIGRRMLGIAAGAAVKLDSDDTVTMGLTVGEGVETSLAARQIGFRPVWALTSVGGIAALPILGGIECLTVLRENDDASRRGCEQCASRWHSAGREVILVNSLIGSDVNDAIWGAA